MTKMDTPPQKMMKMDHAMTHDKDQVGVHLVLFNRCSPMRKGSSQAKCCRKTENSITQKIRVDFHVLHSHHARAAGR